MTDPAALFPQRDLILLAPHYDDAGFIWGGLLAELARAGALARTRLRVVQVFSRSNYQVRSPGNADRSTARVQLATGVRLIEDIDYLDALVGEDGYDYELLRLRECVLRGTSWKPGEAFEFPFGDRATFTGDDRALLARVRARVAPWAARDDVALLVPMAVKQHIDHLIVREAAIAARRAARRGCAVWFGEDLPYAGLCAPDDLARRDAFVAELGLRPVDIAIDVAAKAEAVMRAYPSQVEDAYRQGVLNRSAELSRATGFARGSERLWRWPIEEQP